MADTQPIFGLSDEQIAQLQQVAQQNQAQQVASMALPGQGPSLYYRNLAGQGIGQALSNAMGYQDPMVQRNNLLRKAQQLTDIQATANGWAPMSPEYMNAGVQNLYKVGLPDVAQHAQQVAQDWAYKQAETGNKNASTGKMITDTNEQNYKLKQQQEADAHRNEIDNAISQDSVSVPDIMNKDSSGNTIMVKAKNDPTYARAMMYLNDTNPLLRQEGQAQFTAWLDQNSKNKEVKDIPALDKDGKQLFSSSGEPMFQTVLVDKIAGKVQPIGGPGVKQSQVRVNNINTPQNEFVAGAEKANAKIYEDQMNAAQAAPVMRDFADRLDAITKKGAYSGSFADAQSSIANLFNSLGIPVDMSKAANTAELQSLVNETIRQNAKSLGTGNGFSNSDLIFMQKTMPQVAVSEEARKAVANLFRQRALANEARFQTTLKNLKASGVPIIGANELLGGTNAVNPLPGEINSNNTGLPTAPTAPDMSGRTVLPTATNPLTPTRSVDQKGQMSILPGDQKQFTTPGTATNPINKNNAPKQSPYKSNEEVINAYHNDVISADQMQEYLRQLILDDLNRKAGKK